MNNIPKPAFQRNVLHVNVNMCFETLIALPHKVEVELLLIEQL